MNAKNLLYCVLIVFVSASLLKGQSLDLELRYQEPTTEGAATFHRMTRPESWQAKQTAVIVCDMWDSHHCVNAVRRVAEIAPRIDRFCQELRSRGVTIIHAPSSCMGAYEKHPARLRATTVKRATSMPSDIASWCDRIPSEETAAYPVDQSEGGEDDDPEDHRLWAERLTALGRNPRSPWLSQTSVIQIDETLDYISDSGTEIWSILEQGGISNVILVGVHTNMCVLGRPFGLRRLSAGGKNVVLARDLTDTMYNPQAWPFASHFTGTDLVVSHVERFVCPTISASQVLGGHEFRFAGDRRPTLVMLLAEDEYKTEVTLPAFAAKHLSQSFRVVTCFGSANERNEIVGMQALRSADALLVSVRRRALPKKNLDLVREFVTQGKPVIGIRTASHAFSLKDKPAPEGLDVWPEFDAAVWGGNYTNHYGNGFLPSLKLADSNANHPILNATQAAAIHPGGSLYKTAPLAAGSHVLLEGAIEGENPEPVAWTYIRSDGGRSFYTSLGHVDDFAQAEFEALLAAGIHWACGLTPQSLKEVQSQNERYADGSGKQR